MSTYYKVLPEDLNCRGFQYKEGLNIDTNTIDENECSYGLHFSNKKHILGFCDYGSIIAEVELPEDAIVYHFGNKSKADKLILKNIRPLWSVETMEDLMQEDVDFELFKNSMLYEAARHGYLDIVKFLIEHGADIHENNDYILQWASGSGYLDVIKCLVEHGADIHADDDEALHWASTNGCFDIVKYLVEQGADIHESNDYALIQASCNGYLDIVKYLVGQGADIHACDDFAIRYAGTIEIEEYLKSLK